MDKEKVAFAGIDKALKPEPVILMKRGQNNESYLRSCFEGAS